MTGSFEVRFPGFNISMGDGPSGQVVDWSIHTDFLTATDSWSITILDDRPQPRWYELQQVELYVEGRKQLIGRVDSTDRGDEGYLVKLQGRDYLADLTECNIDPTFVAKAGDKLDTAILLAAAPCGITSIVDPYGRNEERIGNGGKRGEAITAKQLTDNKPSDSDSIYSWCNRAAARASYTIQPGNSRSELVLQRPTYGGGAVAKLLRQKGNKANNIVRGNASRNYGAVPTHFTGASQQGSAKEARTKNRTEWDLNEVVRNFSSEELKAIVWNGTIAGRRTPKDTNGQGNSGQLYRLRHLRDKNAKNQEQLDGTTARMIAGALKELLRYTVELRGTSDPATGNVWSYDCEVDVDDDIAHVHERLWVAARTFTGSGSEAKTELECWRPRTYQIDPEGNG